MNDPIFSISNIKNYKTELEYKNANNYIKSIVELLTEFLNYTVSNVKVKDNKYYLFIIKRGLGTIIHIFKILLLYTRNFSLALYHTKKAYIYYVEFIGQIGFNQNIFLQLNSKDATLFVYKKTIFNINAEYKKNHYLQNGETMIFDILSHILNIYVDITMYALTDGELEMIEVVRFYKKTCNKLIQKLYTPLHSNKVNFENIKIYNFIIREFFQKKFSSIEKIISILNIIVKKFNKQPMTKSHIQNKLLSHDFKVMQDKNSSVKLANWFLGN